MSTFEELKNHADPLRRKGKCALALPLYEEIWEKYRERCGVWDGWAYAHCLYKEKRYAEALALCRTIYSMNRDLAQVKNLYAWCIYRTEIRKEKVEDPARFLRAASAIVTLCSQTDTYSPYTITVLKVLDFYSKPFKAEEILAWTSKLDPEALSTGAFSFQDPKGKTRELASHREKYYALRTEALLETEAYEECEALCTIALQSIGAFHYYNDLWLKRRIALVRWKTGRTAEALVLLKEVLAKKRDWFIKKEMAQIHAERGETEEALKVAVDAALDPGDTEMKVRLYDFLAGLFRSVGDEGAERMHAAFALTIRLARGWKVPEELAERVRVLGINAGETGEEKAQHDELRKLWESLRAAQRPKLLGRISKILPNGKAGFIEMPDRQSYYFRLPSFQGRRDRAVVGTEVHFNLEDGFDSKKNRPSQVAVNVTAA